jgi:EAL domain-containing protein (putative c-di-GMP-specific phosphodiesterase class I)
MTDVETEIQAQIRGGIAAFEFEPFFQPIVSLVDSSLVGFEALARWRHPTRGLLLPAEFVAAAEMTGLIRTLDSMILGQAWQAFDNAVAAHADVSEPLLLSVNLSACHLGDNRIVDRVATLMDEGRGAVSRLQFEITETLLVDDVAVASGVLDRLKALGVSIALDDFGTGYSTLVYLHRFPVDCIKIDRIFLESVTTSERSRAIVRSVVALAKSMGLRAVAEGVERSDVAAALLALGCPFGQGIFFGEPLPASQLPEMLKAIKKLGL